MITITAVYDEQRPSINLQAEDVGGAIAARAAAQEALDRQHAAETAAASAQSAADVANTKKQQVDAAADQVAQNLLTTQQQADIATQAAENTQVAIVEVATNIVTLEAIVASIINQQGH